MARVPSLQNPCFHHNRGYTTMHGSIQEQLLALGFKPTLPIKTPTPALIRITLLEDSWRPWLFDAFKDRLEDGTVEFRTY